MRCLFLLALCGCGQAGFGAHAVEVGVLPQSSTIQGRDGGQSGVVWGHSVWTFGDTVLNVKDALGTNWHHNSFSITDDLDGRDGIDGFSERLDAAGAPAYFLAPTVDEAAFNTDHYGDSCKVQPCGARFAVWPGAPIWDAARNRALIFYGLIYAEPGDFNFHGVGQSVAVWSDFTQPPERPVITPGAEHPTLLFSADDPPWGSGALIDQDGLLYVLGCDSHADGLAPPCYLARVDPASVLDRTAWRYFHDGAWSDAQRSALFVGAPTVTVGYSAHLQSYLAVYCEPLSNRVVARTAKALSGPWSEARLLFDAKKPSGGAYDASWHREYDAGATIYVTFSRGNGMGWFGSEFVLERVTLP